MILLTILIFIIILGLLVFVHELGHFVMAKRAGMAVEEFGFGFPPRIFGIKKGETIYSINFIPLGGFVKILGEDGGETDNPKSFGNKSFSKRLVTLLAGVTMNLIFAWLLIAAGLGLGLPTAIGQGEKLPSGARIRNVAVAILEVQPQSPAAAAGLKVGDKIIRINDHPVDSIDQAQSLTAQNAGKPTKYELFRGSTDFTKTIIPRTNPPPGQGALGIALSSVGLVSYPWYQVLPRGLVATVSLVGATLSAFGSVIGNLFTGHKIGLALSGPVGIAVLTRDVAQLGFIYVLQFTAVLSLNLGIINAVPFPALDGGRVLFLVIEKIKGSKIHLKTEQAANTIGFILLLALMVVVTVHDVGRFSTQFHNLFQRIKSSL